MFGLSTARIVIYCLILLAFVGLSWTANHYHNAWVEAQQTIAVKTVELNNALESAKACSDNTKRLFDEAEAKSDAVKKAQDAAAIIANNNKAMANKILSFETNNTNRCQAAVELFRDYKNGMKAK